MGQPTDDDDDDDDTDDDDNKVVSWTPKQSYYFFYTLRKACAVKAKETQDLTTYVRKCLQKTLKQSYLLRA